MQIRTSRNDPFATREEGPGGAIDTSSSRSLVAGALLGLVLGRGAHGRALQREPAMLDAVCWSTGAWFVLGGLGSMFVERMMVEFFQQSGYAAVFFRVIVAVEIVGGMALPASPARPAPVEDLEFAQLAHWVAGVADDHSVLAPSGIRDRRNANSSRACAEPASKATSSRPTYRLLHRKQIVT